MRKLSLSLFVLLLVLVAAGAVAASLAPGEYTVGDNLPSGWYSIQAGDSSFSAVFLPSGCSLKVAAGVQVDPVEVKSFTLEAGIYTVGKQVPPGLYSIEAIEGSGVNYHIDDEGGRRVLGGVVRFREENERIGNIELLDGYKLTFDGVVRFGPAGGLKFD